MSKRNIDGELVTNRLNLVEAKGQGLLASLFGAPAETKATGNGAKSIDEDGDLKEEFDPESLGVGGIAPRDGKEDGFTSRTPTSTDKLLEQLIGKKKAKAHRAAQKEAMRPNAKAQRSMRAKLSEKEESEDEEGRGTIFKSKRRKARDSEPVEAANEIDDGEDESRTERLESGRNEQYATAISSEAAEKKDELSDNDEAVRTSKNKPKRVKVKPKSFLDEVLAERSKKKNKKNK